MNGKGYQKVEAFATYIRVHLAPISAELCLAYLADVRTGDGISTFEKSEWFKRGWTLQELLAPRMVVFVTKEWHVIGHKGESTCAVCRPFIGSGLETTISRVTKIPEEVLHDYKGSINLSVHDKMKWMEGRETTRPEDMSYALFGIVGVSLPTIYGEKDEGARQRLLATIQQRDKLAAQQAEHYRKIADWLASPDPWTDHESARRRHEPRTGAWLLHHNQYLAWKFRSCRSLWIYGKAACGKTILCSTAIEDVQGLCKNATEIGHAIFYFSFSDNNKQTYRNLIVSLVVQLATKEPGLSMLRQAYEKAERRQPGLDELQKILSASIASYDEVFLHLDALDECPEGDGVRQNKYVSTQMSRDRKLSRLERFRTMIEDTLAQKADGMFRWVYCQLQMLKEIKGSRPSSVQAALRALPKDLDETYERMLDKLIEDDRPYALTLLRWLVYAQSQVVPGWMQKNI
ncbi:hypothetical protein LTR22_026304 [Elasticomyces elasticus]|nr:hypothetical protein LTR22_026304 [Elasticomyces elasticus]KAK4902985.1 hypothetical protein LTR49_026950 [Elasticomyces elasticus]KAK5733402.1 hypothetical protein LTS12_026957 [Elasticomyces elasticus]